MESKCIKGCDLALASYYVWPGISAGNITSLMHSNVLTNSDDIKSYNKDKVFNGGVMLSLYRSNIPFPCDCIGGEFLGHVFEYSSVAGDTYDMIAMSYSNLTTVELLKRFNNYDPNHIPVNAKVNVTVNCSCGNSLISKDYGLFITYPLRPGNNLQELSKETNIDAKLLQSYNPGINFSQESGIVFIPGRGMFWCSSTKNFWYISAKGYCRIETY